MFLFRGNEAVSLSKLKPKLELKPKLPPCNTEFKFECKFKELLKNSQPRWPEKKKVCNFKERERGFGPSLTFRVKIAMTTSYDDR